MDVVKERKPGRLKVPEKSTDYKCPTCPPIIKSLWTGGKNEQRKKIENPGRKNLVVRAGQKQEQNNAQVIWEGEKGSASARAKRSPVGFIISPGGDGSNWKGTQL